jgi:lipopolysaccharide/colanic/teichoic acid biosynthesis glycosyltransferase
MVLASTALVILAPLLAVVGVVIVCDSPGPVLFRQLRVGKGGRTFVMLKFRTMRPDRRKQTLGLPANMPERRQVHKSPHDPRITRAGRFLRRSSLDEVPQLWNVLRGDMSLVGPRPELPEIVAKYEPWQHLRHVVPPGITGWWQVNRDGVRLMHEATELDLYYVEHWSVRLDLLILARTLLVAMRGVGAF